MIQLPKLSNPDKRAWPWVTPCYLSGVATARIAGEIAGDFRDVCRGDEIHKPPFCLRIVRAYRTPAMQAFRDAVAAETRKRRQSPEVWRLDFVSERYKFTWTAPKREPVTC